MTDHRAQVDQLLADYRRSRDQLASVHRELASISESATSEDGLITATVGARGVLTGLVIADEAYEKYRPVELAAQIVKLTGGATVKAFEGAGEVLAPALPSGTDPQALLLGTADLSAEELAPDEVPDDEDESFDDRSWLAQADWPRTR
ncbi:YbaB/EbfC family nucleoid-associated protein [Prauserella cavernicola]|uniref:YbaB/EbfC family nucleoid-associated protein n=1 Tax=Prauserella cavernicola TaxID=2800127 RepID=A0A934QYM9_9PSEU|nr:YbaB/EbfC family nucleoid-associated protein [Prauserella cavernicola]MBK1788841.1 YbaB/EbfC family nucleoid-associated protein [Prauserella cavernicola]